MKAAGRKRKLGMSDRLILGVGYFYFIDRGKSDREEA